jgi:pimeloyl-ACP methyl ester carboxylesterase
MFTLFFALSAVAGPPPMVPSDPLHPGSKHYSYRAELRVQQCLGRTTNVLLPEGDGPFPVVFYGHGQALGFDSYRGTLEHLARKGIAAVFPPYDTGFFDRDWQRMGRDFVAISSCVLANFSQLDSGRVVYAGHSKGAYVAAIAAGLAPGLRASVPGAVLLFAVAGADVSSLRTIHPDSSLTVIFSDKDTVVSRSLSETSFKEAGARLRQFIFVKSYETEPPVNADHMWPLTKGGFVGGGPESALHYYGAWKWLVAAARDLGNSSRYTDSYLYGEFAADKGLGLQDEVRRSW